jgi:putative salt-induced outer membrane protein YdiY
MNMKSHIAFANQRRDIGLTVLSAAALLLTANPIFAADSIADTNKWTADVASGFAVTSGNSDTVLGTLAFKAQRLWERDELRFGINGAYGRSDGEVNNELAAGAAQYNHLFTERLYGSVRLDALHDAVSGIHYRFMMGPAAGYYFIKSDRTRVNGEVGPAAVMEETTDEYSTYFTIRFTERWEQKISETAKFWEQVDYLPPVDDFTGNFLINAEVGLEVTINSRLALREVFTWNFDNEPDENRRSYDLKSVTSLVYKF